MYGRQGSPRGSVGLKPCLIIWDHVRLLGLGQKYRCKGELIQEEEEKGGGRGESWHGMFLIGKCFIKYLFVMLSMQRITSSSSDIASSTAEDGGKATESHCYHSYQ